MYSVPPTCIEEIAENLVEISIILFVTKLLKLSVSACPHFISGAYIFSVTCELKFFGS